MIDVVPAKKRMSGNQIRIIEEYIKCFNVSQTAQALRLHRFTVYKALSDPEVQKEIQARCGFKRDLFITKAVANLLEQADTARGYALELMDRERKNSLNEDRKKVGVIPKDVLGGLREWGDAIERLSRAAGIFSSVNTRSDSQDSALKDSIVDRLTIETEIIRSKTNSEEKVGEKESPVSSSPNRLESMESGSEAQTPAIGAAESVL